MNIRVEVWYDLHIAPVAPMPVHVAPSLCTLMSKGGNSLGLSFIDGAPLLNAGGPVIDCRLCSLLPPALQRLLPIRPHAAKRRKIFLVLIGS